MADQDPAEAKPSPFGGFEPVVPLEFEDSGDSPELRPEAAQVNTQVPKFTPPRTAPKPKIAREETQWTPRETREEEVKVGYLHRRVWRSVTLRLLVAMTPIAILAAALIVALTV